MADYLNHDCWCSTIGTFLSTSQDTWMDTMIRNHRKSTPYALSPENLRAWRNSFSVLQEVFREVSPAFCSLHIVFEYCLPKHPPQDGQLSPYCIWADAIIVSRETAVVLEFKDRPDAIIQHARQARMYRNRLQKYHDSSIGMRKWAILVPTMASGLEQRMMSRVTAASPDLLASVLQSQFGSSPQPHPDIRHWINSTYSIHHETTSSMT